MVISLTTEIISLCMSVSNHHVIQLKIYNFYVKKHFKALNNRIVRYLDTDFLVNVL